jgi:hypothetical protein
LQNVPIAASENRDIGSIVAVVIGRNRNISGLPELNSGKARLGALQIPSAVAENGNVRLAVTVVIGWRDAVIAESELFGTESVV